MRSVRRRKIQKRRNGIRLGEKRKEKEASEHRKTPEKQSFSNPGKRIPVFLYPAAPFTELIKSVERQGKNENEHIPDPVQNGGVRPFFPADGTEQQKRTVSKQNGECSGVQENPGGTESELGIPEDPGGTGEKVPAFRQKSKDQQQIQGGPRNGPRHKRSVQEKIRRGSQCEDDRETHPVRIP